MLIYHQNPKFSFWLTPYNLCWRPLCEPKTASVAHSSPKNVKHNNPCSLMSAGELLLRRADANQNHALPRCVTLNKNYLITLLTARRSNDNLWHILCLRFRCGLLQVQRARRTHTILCISYWESMDTQQKWSMEMRQQKVKYLWRAH